MQSLDALESLLLVPGSLDALLLACLLDRDPDDEPMMEGRVELVLYVIEGSESCAREQVRLACALRRYDERDIRLVVRNVRRDPLGPDDPRVVVVPTLVIRKPRAAYLAGDFDTEKLDFWLSSAGVRRARR